MNDEQKSVYITTTIPYVNADAHVGTALELIQADAYARMHRLLGKEVFFNTGADEHGQKIWEKAQVVGQETQSYVDDYAARLQNVARILNISNDAFIRTTNPAHKEAAQVMWERAAAAGDIYKKKYKGLYCVSDEMFLTEKDLVDGHCVNHPDKEPIELEEENYFFALSKYKDKLLDYLSQPGVIVPEFRRKEAVNFVEKLEDISISRVKEKMAWGVPVPGDEGHVMYVWFDALTNYISTLGWPDDADGNFAKFWTNGQSVQMAGKDQVRFQSILWQAMLFSVGVENTNQIFYHGFINSGGQKMSKSIGNVLDPLELADRYGTDALRYYLLRHIHPVDDSDMTLDKFHEAYTAHLVNGLGNLVSRLMNMSEKYCPQPHLNADTLRQRQDVNESALWKDVTQHLDEFNFLHAMDLLWHKVNLMDLQITEKEPFKVYKQDPEQAQAMIQSLVWDLAKLAGVLAAFLPGTSEKINQAILTNKKPVEPLFPRIERDTNGN